MLVCDPRPARLSSVCAMLPGTAVRCAGEPASLAEATRGSTVCVAAVGVEQPGGDAPVLEAIRILKRSGCAVVCYGEGVHGWKIGMQSRLLLAGAVQLLDSADREFAVQLTTRLDQLCRMEDQRQAEEQAVIRLMHSAGLLGASPALLATFRWVLRVSALSDVPTLFLGETGTGKELLARAIHKLDPKRRRGPFVAVNCAAIAPGVAESEMFGHHRGAYTGAQHERRGLVRTADGGVLFLDEVGELDDALQGKLLRVVQEGRVLAVGEDREVSVDVRVIAATNRDLEAMVQRRTFRSDLFHRLNVLTVRVPPLRQRPEDVAPLVEHFAVKYGAAWRPVATERFIAALQQVDLSGNVRQLENLVRRTLAAKEDDRPLDLADLPPETLQELAEPFCVESPRAGEPPACSAPAPAVRKPDAAGMDPHRLLMTHGWNLARSLAYCERLLVQAALAASDGNHSRTARLLGISVRSVYNKVHRHHLEE